MRYELRFCAMCKDRTVHYGCEGIENCIRCTPLPRNVIQRTAVNLAARMRFKVEVGGRN